VRTPRTVPMIVHPGVACRISTCGTIRAGLPGMISPVSTGFRYLPAWAQRSASVIIQFTRDMLLILWRPHSSKGVRWFHFPSLTTIPLARSPDTACQLQEVRQSINMMLTANLKYSRGRVASVEERGYHHSCWLLKNRMLPHHRTCPSRNILLTSLTHQYTVRVQVPRRTN